MVPAIQSTESPSANSTFKFRLSCGDRVQQYVGCFPPARLCTFPFSIVRVASNLAGMCHLYGDRTMTDYVTMGCLVSRRALTDNYCFFRRLPVVQVYIVRVLFMLPREISVSWKRSHPPPPEILPAYSAPL